MFGALADGCGYTHDEIRQMTLLDAMAQFRYWGRNPPLRVLAQCIASALGVKFPDPKEIEKPKHLTADEAWAMFRMTGGRIT